MKTSHGYIIAVEGIDAVGKNTQSLLLCKRLSKKGVNVALMSFPDYHTPIGREIKSFLSRGTAYPAELQHLLFAANRWEKLDEIRSHLRRGRVLVINRYTESNLAYGIADGLDADWLANLEKGLPAANLVVVLDAPVRTAASRRPGSGKDAYEKSSALQSRAKKAYRGLARERGWRLVDASRSVKDVQAAVVKTVKETLERELGLSI